MGSTRHHDFTLERDDLERMYWRAMVGEPQSLSEAEVDLRTEPLTTDPRPSKARAWVHYREPVRVNCYVLAYTSKAARITWQEPSGTVREAWVWLPAVRDEPWVVVG